MPVVRIVYQMDVLLDGTMLVTVCGKLYLLGIAQQFSGDAQDFAFQGGGEQQGLTIGRGRLRNITNRIREAQIQHAIGFVQYQNFQAGKIHTPGLHVIHQPAGSCDQQIQRLF